MSVILRAATIAAALASAFPALAQQPSASTLAPVVVTANGIPTQDSDATYASEVHDRAAIEASGAATLSDYLSRHTSMNVVSGYGNRNAPLIDMRGYGLEAGFQNVAIVVDGYRINNIDQATSYLGAIAIDAVDSIEISKGSGSVAFGDGAMAGVVQIRTRARNGMSLAGMAGSRGAQSATLNAGLTRELFDLNFSASNEKQASLSSPDVTGQRDGSDNRTERANLTLKPVSALKLFLGGSNAHVDTRYVDWITTPQFNADPGQNGGKTYNHQIYESTQWRVGAEYELSAGLTARYMRNSEDKLSNFLAPFAFRSDYNYSSDDASLSYRSQAFDLAVGVHRFKGERFSATNLTTKDNTAHYMQGTYRLGQLALSAGTRREKVEYDYRPNAGAGAQGEHNLDAWDLGANYRFSEQVTGFLNYNQAYQAPDIDRFFLFGGGFNGLIDPARSKSVTLGINHSTSTNRLRVAVFRSKLSDEIYFNPLTFANTNIDKSHKKGFEISERWQASDKLSLSALYIYTRAFIDNDDFGGGTFDGKELPGVSRHGLALGASYQPWSGGTLNLSHTWRSSAYSISNFANDNAFRQSAYNSTSLILRQRWNKVEVFAGIDNLFDQKNGLFVYSSGMNDNVVYPIDFRRTLRVGIRTEL